MSPAQRKFVILAAIGLVLAALVGGLVWRTVAPREYEIKSAVITAIDVAAGRGRIEIIHPKTGQKIDVDAAIPPETPITIDGRPAQLADVRVGDAVAARGRYAWGATTALWVRVTRAAPPSRPTTQAASAPVERPGL